MTLSPPYDSNHPRVVRFVSEAKTGWVHLSDQDFSDYEDTKTDQEKKIFKRTLGTASLVPTYYRIADSKLTYVLYVQAKSQITCLGGR